MFPLTVDEVIEKMSSWDEIYALEELGLNTYELLQLCRDRIEANLEYYSKQVDWEED